MMILLDLPKFKIRLIPEILSVTSRCKGDFRVHNSGEKIDKCQK